MFFTVQRLTILVLFVCLAGCTSISSTLLTRDESNNCWEKHPHLKGIPITLNVPTHMKIYVYDKHFLSADEVGGQDVIRPVETDIPIRDFSHELLYTDKIFTVDFKRPAAGSYNLRLDMSDKQYFEKIQHDVTDETIEKVAGLVEAVVGGPLITPSALASKPDLKEVQSLVAVGVFNLDDPDFEQQVVVFLNCHLNKSHDAWVVPPDTKPFKRVGMPDDDSLNTDFPSQPFCNGMEGCLQSNSGEMSYNISDFTMESVPNAGYRKQE